MIIVSIHLLLGFNYHYEFMGWDGLLLLNILHNNQLKQLGIQVTMQWLLCQYMYLGPGVKNFKAA